MRTSDDAPALAQASTRRDRRAAQRCAAAVPRVAVAAAIAAPLGIGYRAGLVPEDKIAFVRDLQRHSHVVLMVRRRRACNGGGVSPWVSSSDVTARAQS
jgi:high-affinity K+ transport system ATPase subunit B